MTNIFSQVKESLVALLKDADYKVITLKGKWGTGKTYLWHSVRKDLSENHSKMVPIYVSLFGAKSINELKLRILQNAYLKDTANVKKILGTIGSGIKGVLNKFTGVSAEDSLLVWLPNITDDRLIVIDDIERKHKSLDIDELLGFLDEYSETHNTRFLLLLNTDKLLDHEMWATLHEKVIDAELVLNPSPSEAFEIATINKNSLHLAEVKAALAILNVNNIRVIKRVLKLVEHISSLVLEDGVPNSRWVPSTVLLAASHYHAVENPPPTSYILSFNIYTSFAKKEEKATEEELAWDSTLSDLGINYPEEYEEILVSFFTTGLLDSERLKSLFLKYKDEGLRGTIEQKIRAFYDAIYWDPNKSQPELIEMAEDLFNDVGRFNPSEITHVVSQIEKLGNVVLAKKFLDSWIVSADSRPEFQSLGEIVFETRYENIHPDVVAKLNEMRDEQHPPLTVMEAVQRIIKNSGWGEPERIALQNSTVEIYEKTLKNSSGCG